MKRTHFLNDWAECADRDDLIPRCAESGYPPMSADKPTVLDIHQHPLFASRVRDALARLRKGESVASVRERHGGVVLEVAQRDGVHHMTPAMGRGEGGER